MCEIVVVFFFFKQKTAYEMRISDWSSDVCSSDLPQPDRRSLREFDQADQDDDEGRILDEIRLRAHPRRQRQIAAIADADRGGAAHQPDAHDRKSVVEGKSVSGRVDLGGRRIIKKKKI